MLRMDPCVILLEDDPDRLVRFELTLPLVDSSLKIVHWRSATRMTRECEPHLDCCRLICLDHDLVPAEGEKEDPGDGLIVARFLAARPPKCPVLIHSSNGDRVARMMGELQLAGWRVDSVLPFGADWIESYWRSKVESLLGR